MDSEATFAMLVDSCGAGWAAVAAYQWPAAWRAARVGNLVAANLAAVTAQCLLVTAMLTWPSRLGFGKRSAAFIFEPLRAHELPIRVGVLAALSMLLAALLLTLTVGIRSRTTEKELIA